MQKMVKFRLGDNVQDGTKMVSDNGPVRVFTLTVQKKIFSLNKLSDVTKAQVSYSKS